MTPRKVLHIVTQLELGGAQRSTLALLTRLDRRKFTPTLASSDGWLTDAACRIPDLRLRLFPDLHRTINPLTDALALAQLTSFIRRGRFELVHTHSSKAGIVGRWAAHRAGCPAIVHTIHGFGFHAFQPVPLRRCYEALERVTARITDRLIVVSERDREIGLKAGIGTPQRYRLIRYGIDADVFALDGEAVKGASHETRRALGLHPERPVVGTVACLKPQKAPHDFVEAFHRIRQDVPEVQGILVGDGRLRPQVERLLRRFGLEDSLRLLGWREDVPRLLHAMDVFVLTSRWEGLPIACLEAMASGLPVVATTAGGVPEVVTSGHTGFLVPIGRPHETAAAVVRLLRDRALRRRMHEAGPTALDGRFTMERMVADTEQLYKELLEEGHRPC